MTARTGGEEKRRAVGDAAHHAADQRPESEPEPEGGADHAHGARPFFGRGHIGDVGLGNGDVPAGDPGQNPPGEKQRERLREAHERETGRGADDAHEQNRPPSEAIGEFAEDRREDDLHAGINAGEPADRDRGGVEVLRVKRQDRNDDAEAHQVDEDGEEEDEER